jgi:hypothetical protein
LKKFEARYTQFVDIFKRREDLHLQERRSAFPYPDMKLSDIMQAGLPSGKYWFAEATGSFYGFDGLFRWSLARHGPRTKDSMTVIVARWIGMRKLDDLHTLGDILFDGANGPKGTADTITRAPDTFRFYFWPYASIGLVSVVISYLCITHRAKLA